MGKTERRRDLADQFAVSADAAREAADSAWEALASAERGLDRLSDQGLIATVALSAGIAGGLLLAGAPRVVLVVALVPAMIAARSALNRGVRPSHLLN